MDCAEIKVTPAQRQLLTKFLASPQRPEGTLSYHALQGFLFAVASAPVLIKPSEWLPVIFNEQDGQYASMEEAQSVLDALMVLYNSINAQVFEGTLVFPEDISAEEPALENVGSTTALGQWSRGFLHGHEWLVELWDQYTPDALDEELGSCLMILSFFCERRLAEAYHQELVKPGGQSLDELAGILLGKFEMAMRSYAHLGRSISAALAEQQSPQEPLAREHKVGRNDPCPCGSGRKYKHCCLH